MQYPFIHNRTREDTGMSRYLTVDEVATLMRVKKQTIYKWVCERKLSSFAVGGRTIFEESEVHKWISEHKREASNV
jgi:excisionase family DNA binding protein